MKYAVVTLSDRASSGQYEDLSGKIILNQMQAKYGASAHSYKVLPDQPEYIENELLRLSDEEECDLVLTTGGTGLSPKDLTPDATRAVVDREIPGIAEAIRFEGLKKTKFAMLSRGTCGVRGKTLIINLSGSQKAVNEQLEIVMPILDHAVEIIQG